MPTLYKIITAVLAAAGCAGLALTGEVNLLMSTGGLALFPGYFRYLRGGPHASARTIGLFSLLTLGVFVFDAAVSGDVFLAVAHLTISFQAIKSFDLKDPWDHLQVYFVSLLQLLIASELTQSIAFGALFVLFMGLFVTAMVQSHFLKEGQPGGTSIGRPVLAILFLTALLTGVFFTAIPRTSYKLLGKGHLRAIRTTGFSDRVEFGSFGDIKLDPTVIMRVEMSDAFAGPYYWRGTALDFFDGRTWQSSERGRRRTNRTEEGFIISPPGGRSGVEQTIYLEAIDSDIIFGLPEVRAVKAEARYLSVDREGGLYLPGKTSKRVQYTAYSEPAAGLPGTGGRGYLQLPHDAGKIVGLAGEIAAGAQDAFGKAARIEAYLKSNYSYSLLTEEPPGGMGPIEDFLFRSKRGYCEHYATAMVLMLRGIGIEARIVTGFLGGERNDYGNYLIVRQSNAHSWVEALIGGVWRRFDPTPGVVEPRRDMATLILDSIKMSWTRYVIGFSSTDQKRLLRGVSLPFTRLPSLRPVSAIEAVKTVSFLLLPALVFALIYVLGRKRRRYGFVTARYLSVRELLRKRGAKITGATTPGDILRAAPRGCAGPLREFLDIYESQRFGKKEAGRGVLVRYDALYGEIRKSLAGK